MNDETVTVDTQPVTRTAVHTRRPGVHAASVNERLGVQATSVDFPPKVRLKSSEVRLKCSDLVEHILNSPFAASLPMDGQ